LKRGVRLSSGLSLLASLAPCYVCMRTIHTYIILKRQPGYYTLL
jgi:hypothetical protein